VCPWAPCPDILAFLQGSAIWRADANKAKTATTVCRAGFCPIVHRASYAERAKLAEGALWGGSDFGHGPF